MAKNFLTQNKTADMLRYNLVFMTKLIVCSYITIFLIILENELSIFIIKQFFPMAWNEYVSMYSIHSLPYVQGASDSVFDGFIFLRIFYVLLLPIIIAFACFRPYNLIYKIAFYLVINVYLYRMIALGIEAPLIKYILPPFVFVLRTLFGTHIP